MNLRPHSQFFKSKQLDGLSALDAEVYQQSFPKHYHDTYQITLAKHGLFKNQIGENLLYAVKNQVSITHPDEVHATLCDDFLGHSFFTLYLPPSLFATKKFKQQSRQPHFSSVIEDPSLTLLLHQIQHLLESKSTSIESTAWRIIDRLMQHHQTSMDPFIETQLQLDLSLFSANQAKFCLETWAQHFGLDKFKFMRLFKIQTGMTPNQYLIFQRIKQSQTLLAEGSDLTDTALECGFYDLPHFHKHFRRITGVTPLTFKQAHTN